jgi:hypothetical protein
MKSFLPLFIFLAGIYLASCCNTKDKNSIPQVIGESYKDTAVKDVYDRSSLTNDSGFYPIYTLDIKNTGTEADTFLLSYERQRNNFIIPVQVQQYVLPGETKTFRTIGPVPDTGRYTSWDYYYCFMVMTPDSVSVHKLKPVIKIFYGRTDYDPEGCGEPAKTMYVNESDLK